MAQFTKEEAKYYYNKYMQAYEEVKGNCNKAASAVDLYKSQRNTQESNLATCKTQKKNLEARLADINAIISLLDNKVPSFIDKANKSVSSADEKYSSAIKCTGITAASVQTAFYTKGVREDSNSADAYERCRVEKKRLEEGIEDLRLRMISINNAINALSSNIRSATNAANVYYNEMKNYYNKATMYAALSR